MKLPGRWRIPLLAVVLPFSLWVVGCTCAPLRPPSPSPTLPPPAPDLSDWSLALEDDFSDPESGFYERSYAHGEWAYRDGCYVIEVTKQNWVAHTWRGRFSDFALEVDVIPQQESGCGGVSFRVGNDGNQYYSFCVSPDGQYVLDKLLGEENEAASWETLLNWRESPYIETGLATNRLKVVCEGSRIWLYVNDNYLGYVQDNGFRAGGVGMVTANYDDDSAKFSFDNLRVYTPPGR